MPKAKTQRQRSRTWACILYVESAREDWIEILKQSGEYGFISPLHDKDLKEAKPDKVGPKPGEEGGDDGDEANPFKKPHYHIMITRENATAAPREFFKSFGGVGAEKIGDKVEYARYLTHSNAPDKAQYDAKDVVKFGRGLDYESFIKGISSNQRYTENVIDNILNFIVDNDFNYNYSDLIDFARTTPDFEEWKGILYHPQRKNIIIDYIKHRHTQTGESADIKRDYQEPHGWTVEKPEKSDSYEAPF